MIRSNEIRIRPGDWAVNEFMLRVSRMVNCDFRSEAPYKRDSGYGWQLDDGNNWWGGVDAFTGEYIVAYRYGAGNERRELLLALEKVILFCLCLEEKQIPPVDTAGMIHCKCGFRGDPDDRGKQEWHNAEAVVCPNCKGFLCWSEELKNAKTS